MRSLTKSAAQAPGHGGSASLTPPKVSRLDPALVDEGFDAEVDPPEADAELLSELALGGLGLPRELAENVDVDFLVVCHASALPCYLRVWDWPCWLAL